MKKKKEEFELKENYALNVGWLVRSFVRSFVDVVFTTYP